MLNYLSPDWYRTTGGLAEFSYGNNPWVRTHLAEQPLALIKTADGAHTILVRESIGGLYVRADGVVHRLDPGASATTRLYATRFGRRHATTIVLGPNNSMIGGGSGPAPLDPPVPVPTVGVPTSGVSYPDQVETGADGSAHVTIVASPGGPGNPRGYIDGQLYGVDSGSPISHRTIIRTRGCF